LKPAKPKEWLFVTVANPANYPFVTALKAVVFNKFKVISMNSRKSLVALYFLLPLTQDSH
jgi:hypothetical protein